MNFHPDDFLRLIEAVEELGGAGLPDKCIPQKYRLQVPDENTGNKAWRDFFTTGCNKETRFVLPYDVQQPHMLPNTDMLSNTIEDGREQRRAREVERAEKVSSPVVSDSVREQVLKRGGGFVTVCAVDDNMGSWPKFKHCVEDGSF